MAENLVIVESPAKAKTINKYLGTNYEVLASYGHIRDLPAKNGSVDPNNNFAMVYELNPNSKKYLDKIVSKAKKVTSILLATDPDREGEAIAWHVVELLTEKKLITPKTNVQRIVFTEITKKAVSEAINNPRTLDLNLVKAQQARRALDYLVGFTLSPLLWRKLPGSKSAGRVQSVAVKLIAERDDDIEKFVKREYWSIVGDFINDKSKKFSAHLTHINNKKLDKFDITVGLEADKIVSELKLKQYKISKIEKKVINRRPQPPFITSTLQQEASRKLGFPIKKTMKIAQELYEGINLGSELIGLITYMRTDGTQISNEAIEKTRLYIQKEFGQNYLPKSPILYKSKSLNAQEAHEAIRPTDIFRHPSDIKNFLSDDQNKLYDLIWKRLVACQMEASRSELTSVDVSSTNDEFKLRASGSVPIFDGYQKVYKEGSDDDSEDEQKQLPKLDEGEKLAAEKFTPNQHFTEPPPRFTEASLVKKLEELGIGRPSTYSTIITVIQDRNYVKLEKKRFFCQDRGRLVASFLNNYFAKYVEYHFTAELENKLDKVSSGEIENNKVLEEFWSKFNENIEDVKLKTNQEIIEVINDDLVDHFFPVTSENEDPRICPVCKNAKLGIKPGKYGMFVACAAYPECKFTKTIEDDSQEDTGEKALPESTTLGLDPVSGEEVLLKKGPYGHYLQLGTKKKPKRGSVPPGIKLDEIDLKKGLQILELPKVLGVHPDSKKDVIVGLGRYGPFVLHNEKYHSLPPSDDLLTIELPRAIDVINGNGVKAQNLGKLLGAHPVTKDDISLLSGKYGPYIKYGKRNIPIAKSINIDEITLESSLEIITNAKVK